MIDLLKSIAKGYVIGKENRPFLGPAPFLDTRLADGYDSRVHKWTGMLMWYNMRLRRRPIKRCSTTFRQPQGDIQSNEGTSYFYPTLKDRAEYSGEIVGAGRILVEEHRPLLFCYYHSAGTIFTAARFTATWY